MISPFRVSSQRCGFFPCDQNADLDIYDKGARLCRQHALFVWSIVDEQIQNNDLDPVEEEKRREAEHQARVEESRKILGPPEGFVYYLQVGELIKIGYASDLIRRLQSYPPGTELLAVERGMIELEKRRHLKFAELRTAGREWYEPDVRLMDHITVIAAEGLHNHFDDEEWQKRKPPAKKNPGHAHVGRGASLGRVG